VGDILSLGYGEQEISFFNWVWDFIDVACLGNHEYPAINSDNRILFSGWDGRDVAAEHKVRSQWNQQEKWVAAASVGDWLITRGTGSEVYGSGRSVRQSQCCRDGSRTE
jgi:hypothetical protein